jgi:transposase
MVDPFVPAIKALLVEYPRLKATVIAERVGFNNGISTSVFRAKVAEIKAQLGVADPADRLVFAPGEQAQFDIWFPETPVEQTGQIHPVLTLIACWSRFLLALMIPTRQCGDILGGMNYLLGQLAGLPQRLLWDNESGIVSAHQLIPQASAWAGAMGASIRLARPRDPETKGRIERANGFLDSSFEPARRFVSIDDFNDQLHDWLGQRANTRIVRATGQRPNDMIAVEREAFTPLPAELPSGVIEITTRLARDYYVRVAGCDYSVDPIAIGKMIEVRASYDRVWATCERQLVAEHKRCYLPWQVITDPEHVSRAADLRRDFQSQMAKAKQAPTNRLVLVEQRDLAAYDHLYRQAA